MSKRKTVNYIVFSSVIAAFYAGLTFISGFFGLAYRPIQFRLSEVLTVLAAFTPAAIPGLTVGCFLANMANIANPIDMVFGTAATLLASLVSYSLRNVRLKKIPLLSLISPIIFNAIFIGLEISLFFGDSDATLMNFLFNSLFVALGESVICIGLGIPFYLFIDRKKDLIFKYIK